MTLAHDFERLRREHHALLRAHARAQGRCSDLLAEQAREIERLQAQAMRLRAAAIVGRTAQAWAQEDRAVLEQSIPGLPRRATLARRVEALLARVQELMRERTRHAAEAQRPTLVNGTQAPTEAVDAPHDPETLEARLVAADLVICQTGCLSHGDYWRVQDHCRRTGKACVLAERPEALRIVRIHGTAPA